MSARARILTIAGSDSSGGAGIQADLKTILALGGYGMSAITAITAQNTQGVRAVEAVTPALIAAQIAAVREDIGLDAVKTGMIAGVEAVAAIAGALQELDAPLVVDPVMVASSGAALSTSAAIQALVAHLVPRATLITPNLPEAEALLGRAIKGSAAQDVAARDLLDLGCPAVLLKGGHGEGAVLVDILATRQGVIRFEGPRIATTQTHGTGCTLASAIATGLGQGLDLPTAILRARAYVRQAILNAPGLGQGHGPLDHGHAIPI